MLSQHRNKAFLGLGCWLASLAGLVLLVTVGRPAQENASRSSLELFGIVVVASLFVQFFLYLWGAHHLAKGRGQPEVLALLGFLCFIGQLLAVAALLALPDKYPQRSRRNSAIRKQHRHTSGLAFVIRCRRNALVGISLGFCGIGFGVSLVLWPGGFPTDPANIRVAGMFIFLLGYIGVITGCWWWLKAKRWNDAIIFIGLMPLGILFVPFVRLILVQIPALLPMGMVFMPFVLIVVILALPDRSGASRRTQWRNRP